MINVLMVVREPNAYNNDLFNTFKPNGIDLDVIHLTSKSNNNATWEEQFKRTYSHEIIQSLLKQIVVLPKKIIKNYSVIIIAGWATPGSIISLIYCLLFRKKFFIWADTVTGSYPKKLYIRILRTPIRYLAITKSTAILTTGKPGRASLEKLGCHPGKIIDFPYTVDQNKLIKNSTNVTNISRNITKISANRPILFFAGQIIFRKGLDILLRAIRNVVDDGIEVLLVIEGEGPLRKYFETIVRELDIENNVLFVGFNQSANHASLLGISDIVVVPSRWDPWGNLVHEAMVLSKTVIASTGVCSAQDRIKHGINGFLYSPEDVYDLQKLIYECLTTPNLLKSIGIEAHATAVTWPADRNLSALQILLEDA